MNDELLTEIIFSDFEDEHGLFRRMYMYAPNCFCADKSKAMEFHVVGAAKSLGDILGCHEGDGVMQLGKPDDNGIASPFITYRWGVRPDRQRKKWNSDEMEAHR